MPLCGKTEGVLQIDKMRMRFALVHICSCAALSVICFANASSPEGRAKKSVRTRSLTNQGDLMRTVRVLLLPSRLAPRHLPQGGRLLPYAQSNLSLPLGEMSRSDREG